MATSSHPTTRPRPRPGASGQTTGDSTLSIFHQTLQHLASLKITVTLFALSIFLVLVGTLAQVEKDIWQVVEEYFRTPVAWIDLRVFFPPSFFPGLSLPHHITLPGGRLVPLGFYFPGGWLIGAALLVNLIAAHSVRFSVHAKGPRLIWGWAIITIGCLLTWAVIASGSVSSSEATLSTIPYEPLRIGILVASGLACLAFLFAAIRAPRDRNLTRGLALLAAAAFGAFLAWTLSAGPASVLGDSALRIVWQLFKGQIAALALLLGCAMVFKHRAGIVLLHGGIGLMMLGEVLTGLTAVEGHMQMAEGETTSYVRHTRHWELAIIAHTQPDQDTVIAIPESRLIDGARVQDPLLPFDLKLAFYFQNSSIRPAGPRESNPATTGIGVNWLAEPQRPVAGTDGNRTNMPAGYLTFYRKGTNEELGTHLVGIALAQVGLAEKVEVDGTAYEFSMRHMRTYKPYALTLLDVQKEDYPGTQIPRHYASDLHLIDPSRRVDRNVKIWMNNPLRFAGETFYQSGYFRDPETGQEASTLAVVTNSGWMIPYVGCMLVATGMLAQFASGLLRFLRRRNEQTDRDDTDDRDAQETSHLHPNRNPRPHRISTLVPTALVVLSALWLLNHFRPPSTPRNGFDLYHFGQIPVVDHGRAKPLDTLARNSLQTLSNRQTFIDTEGDRQPAVRWLLDLITRPAQAAEYQIFRIENSELLDTLGLKPREGLRYSLRELVPHLSDLRDQVELAATLEAADLSLYQKKVLELDRKLATWNFLIQAFLPPEKILLNQDWAMGPARIPARATLPLVIPDPRSDGGWLTYVQALTRPPREQQSPPSLSTRATSSLTGILEAYSQTEPEAFNQQVAAYHQLIRSQPISALTPAKVDYESYYNFVDPCFLALVLYVVSFLLAAFAWLGFRQPLNRTAFGLAALAWCVHTFVLVSRIYISGRPPVTNLYSSAIFIGWAGVFFCLLLERIYRLGIGTVTAAIAGFSTLLIAYFLGSDGDTFAVLQAVLDTQFWLATHVVCITLGYSATYVAGILGILYIVRGLFTYSLSPDTGKALSRMIYGTTCFALLFSFVGTVLGGLWADDSWGRFWGWDPKENGALIIVLWNALVLHARWGALIKQRGLAILAVAGNIAVSWSWFGVNELGIGLHSYGFTEGVLRSLGLFVLSQLAIIALALLPDRFWRSRRAPRQAG